MIYFAVDPQTRNVPTFIYIPHTDKQTYTMRFINFLTLKLHNLYPLNKIRIFYNRKFTKKKKKENRNLINLHSDYW